MGVDKLSEIRYPGFNCEALVAETKLWGQLPLHQPLDMSVQVDCSFDHEERKVSFNRRMAGYKCNLRRLQNVMRNWS